MTTRITVTVGDQTLLEKAKTRQQANRQSLLDADEGRQFVDDVTRTRQAQANALPSAQTRDGAIGETEIKRETSAQRGADYIAGINGSIQTQIEASVGETNTLSFAVVDPQGGSTTISKVITAISNTAPTLPSNTQSYTKTPNISGVSYPGAGSVWGKIGANWYEPQQNGSPGSAKPEPIEWSDLSESVEYSYTSQREFRSQYYFLPVSKDRGIFVYNLKGCRLTQIFSETRTIERSYTLAAGSNSTTRIFQGDTTDNEIIAVDSFTFTKQNEFFCFVYSKNKIREISTPATLQNRLNVLMPERVLNQQDPSVAGGFLSFQSLSAVLTTPGDAFGGWSSVVLADTTTNLNYSVKAIDFTTTAGPYANALGINTVLAKAFGLGALTTAYHENGPQIYSTPAVYTYLQGAMDLSNPNGKFYNYMRSTYFPMAPRRYISLNVQGESYSEKLFNVTTSSPVSVDQAMPASVFRPVKNGWEGGYNCWDWRNETYCRQQLGNLGFTSADLTP